MIDGPHLLTIVSGSGSVEEDRFMLFVLRVHFAFDLLVDPA